MFKNCPICGSDNLSPLTIVKSLKTELTSTEASFCKSCEHRFFNKLPSNEWFQKYYEDDWDDRGHISRFKKFLMNFKLLWKIHNIIHHLKYSYLSSFYSKELGYSKALNFIKDGVLEKIDKTTKILEIGAGYGSFASL